MSVYQLPGGGSSWNQLNPDTVMDLREDPFWGYKQGTSEVNYAILIEGGVGFLRRSVNGGQTWLDITPSTNPPNPSGDAPGATATDVTYQVIDGSRVAPNVHGVLVNWQNPGNEWRSWLYHTTDDWVTGSWLSLAADTTCMNPGTAYEIPGTVNPRGPGGWSGKTVRQVAKIGTGKYVFVYRDALTTTSKVVACTVSGDVITWGTPVSITGVDNSTTYGGIICAVDTDKFAIAYHGESSGGAPKNQPELVIGTTSGIVVSLATPINLRTAWERSTVQQHTSGSLGQNIHLCSPTPAELIICFLGKNVGSPADCDVEEGTLGWYVIDASISGTTITVPTSTCDVNSVTDMTLISTDQDRGEADLIPMGTTHWCFAWTTSPGSDHAGYIVAGTGTTMGTPVKFSRSDATPWEDWAGEMRLAELTGTLAVVAWHGASYGPYPTYVTALFAISVTRTGTSVALGTEKTLWDRTETPEFDFSSPFDIEVSALSSTQLAIVYHRQIDNIVQTCVSAKTLSVAAGVITVSNECDNFITRVSGQDHWLVEGSTTEILYVSGDDTSRIFTTANIATCVLVPECQGLGLSYGRGIGSKAWATVGDGSILELLEIDISPLSVTWRNNIGPATFAEIASKTWVAYPLVRWFNDDYVMIYGRMDNPQTLGSPAHLIYTTNGGGAFLLNENGFGADHIGAMIEDTANDLYVIRNTGGAPQLYEGTIVGSLSLTDTPSLTSDVSPHGIDLHWDTLSLVLASEDADAILVIAAASPYTSWTDLTSDHGDASTNGLVSVEVL